MLSDSRYEEYQRQGFLVFDPQIDPATIDAAFAGVRDMYLAENEPPNGRLVAYRDNRRIQDAWKIVPAVKAIATAPRVLELLAGLYRRKPLPFQTLNFRVGSEQQPHSVKGWFAKHLAQLRGFMRLRDTGADYAIYERLVRDRITASGIAPTYATIKKGQAFLWAANLVHGGSHQFDRTRTRASQVTHFFFEGCRYYTPLLQHGWKTQWRDPSWIT